MIKKSDKVRVTSPGFDGEAFVGLVTDVWELGLEDNALTAPGSGTALLFVIAVKWEDQTLSAPLLATRLEQGDEDAVWYSWPEKAPHDVEVELA